MRINGKYFCGLSSAPKFLGWLRTFDRAIHDELTIHLRAGHGCAANAKKMLDVLSTITRKHGGEAALLTMLSREFPHVLDGDTGRRDNGVFGAFDPAILTIPRRAIVASEDEARRLVADKPIWDYVTVGGRTYVEYLTTEMAGLANSIPAGNWLIRLWREKNT